MIVMRMGDKERVDYRVWVSEFLEVCKKGVFRIRISRAAVDDDVFPFELAVIDSVIRRVNPNSVPLPDVDEMHFKPLIGFCGTYRRSLCYISQKLLRHPAFS